MEKRKKTLARTLKSVSGFFSKLSLVTIIFVPAWLSAQHFSRLEQKLSRDDKSAFTAGLTQIIEKARPRDLVKIFSIVKANRPDISDTEAWKVSDVLLQESSKHTLDPMLVLAVIEVESRFQYNAVSPMGARGIMQIMPDTGKFLSALDVGRQHGLHPDTFKPEFLDDPIINIKLGVYYLHDLRKQFRNLNLALIAYNVGPTEIQNRLSNNIELSDEYATLVFAAYQKNKKTLPTF
jgi:soluble lytic murein transglycosylase